MKAMNKTAMELLLKQVKQVLKYPVVLLEAGVYYCDYCKVRVPWDEYSYDYLSDENVHKPTCTWRLLKEAYNNLDNEGYGVEENTNGR